MASGGRDTRSGKAVDSNFVHLTTKVLLQQYYGGLTDANVRSYHRLLIVSKDPNVVNSLKWRNPKKNNTEETIPADAQNELEELPSYVNWLQNRYATVNFGFIEDVLEVRATRKSFLLFLRMSPKARQGNADGTVDYDEDQALKSEEYNQLGRFAPPPPPPTPTVVQAGGSSQGGGGKK
jgi:hypothetical protein